MPLILVQKDANNLVPINATAAQRTAYMAQYSIWDVNADGSKSGPYGPTTSATKPTVFPDASGLPPEIGPSLSALVSGAGIPLSMTAPASGFRAAPNEALPTWSIGTAQTAGRTELAVSDAGVVNPRLGLSGARRSNFAARNGPTVVTQRNVLHAARATADTSGATAYTVSVFVTMQPGSTFIELGKFNDNFVGFDVSVDGRYVGGVQYAIHTGTAQAGAASTMTLAAGASATNDFYKTLTLRIVSGTGAGQSRTITGYVGGTRVATVDTAWATAPDATSVYSVDAGTAPVSLSDVGSTLRYVRLTFPASTVPVRRRIDIFTTSLYSIGVGANDVIQPAPSAGLAPCLLVGDSFWDGSMQPRYTPGMSYLLGTELGLAPIQLGSGGTGLWTRGVQRLNLLNRIAPPDEAWEVWQPGQLAATGGTWSISVTFNGATATASGLAHNVSASALEAALNALSFNGFLASSGSPLVGPTGQGCFCVARGDLNVPFIIVANGMPGATVSVDTSAITGATIPAPTRYLGDVRKNWPVDSAGNDQPALLIVGVGSGNDGAAAGYTVAQIRANAQALASAITQRFPRAATIFVGVLGDAVIGDSGVISATDLERNAALRDGATLLPTINGNVPFVDTYSAGLGGDKWLAGTGSATAPTTGKTDVFKSPWNAGHPTSAGAGYLASQLLAAVRGVLTSA